MPLYEYHCVACELTFEMLSALSESHKKKPCPACGKRAPRIVSAFAITSGAVDIHDGQAPAAGQQPQNTRPLCMRYPQVPLSCHMDEYSVKRFAAHSVGRGNEFDDKMAKASEMRKQRGIPEPTYAPPAHGHEHGHDHPHHFRRHAQSREVGSTHASAHGHSDSPRHSHGKGKSHKHGHGAHAH